MTDIPPQLPHGEIEEVLPDIFYVRGESRPNFGGKTLQFTRSMTIVREGTDLTLVNTLRLDDAGLARLDELGTVKHLVKLGAFHGRDDKFYMERYGATLWALPGMAHERGVVTGRELRAGEPGPCADASTFVFETSTTPEGVLVLERLGGVLISCDSLHNMLEPDEHFDEASAQSMQAGGFFGPANIGPGWLRSSKPQPSDFARLEALTFKHLLSAHGTPLIDGAHQAVKNTVAAAFP